MREDIQNLYNCPIMRVPMVIPITFANGKTYDLVSLLQLYKQKYGSLTSTQLLDPQNPLKCPITNTLLQISPDELHPADIIIQHLRSMTFDEYVGLPNDIEIIAAVFRKGDCRACIKYIQGTDAGTLAIKTKNGLTPAHLAAQYGKTETLMALFAKKPELLNATLPSGDTPLDLARTKGHKNTIRALNAIKSENTSTRSKRKPKKRNQPSSTTTPKNRRPQKKQKNTDSNPPQSATDTVGLFSCNVSKPSQNTPTRPQSKT